MWVGDGKKCFQETEETKTEAKVMAVESWEMRLNKFRAREGKMLQARKGSMLDLVGNREPLELIHQHD